MHAPILVLHHHPGCHCPPNSTGTPPTHLLALCHPHQPPPSQIFVVSPVKTGTLSKIFRNFSTFLTFSALGLHPPHPHHPPTLHWLRPHLCTLPCTSTLPLCSIFWVCHPYLTFFLTSDPLPATMGNPALVQPGIVPTSGPLYNQVQPLWPPCCPSVFPVGLHNPHSHSRTWCRWGDVQCHALSTQTTQGSPGAEPRRSKRKLRQVFGIKLNRQLILFQTHRLVAGTQTGHRHPSFRTKHNKTRS